MDFDLRVKALSRLVKSDTKAAEEALGKEFEKVRASLLSETDYDRLEQDLALLEIIEDRFSAEATALLLDFLKEVEKRQITYSDAMQRYESLISEYHNSITLLTRAIDVVLRLRYLEPEPIFHALLGFSEHSVEAVRNKAVSGLRDMARYDLRVFYGDGVQAGIGATPQKIVIEQLEKLGDSQLERHFSAAITIAETLLSPTMEGTAWSYKSVTLSRGATPGMPSVADVRSRTIGLLKRLYKICSGMPHKLRIIAVLQEATRAPHVGQADEATKKMISENAIDVLTFYGELVSHENLQIVQKIESNSYWAFYHAANREVESAAFGVRDRIASNAEYTIYKTLIGFEGVFGDWDRTENDHFEDVDKYRQQKALEFAKSITSKNYLEWRNRILLYAETESQDLATFPNFYRFLEHFALAQPSLAQRLVAEDSEKIAAFLIALLRGLWASSEQQAVRLMLERWISEGRYLIQVVRLFLDNPLFDRPLLASALRRAAEMDNQLCVASVMSVAVSNYGPEKGYLVKELFIPALEFLSEKRNTTWIFDFWFRPQARYLIEELDTSSIEKLLKNLLLLDKIDHHAEEILYLIASRAPDKVLAFLTERLGKEKKKNGKRFEAIPFSLHKLNEPLSKAPGEAVRSVRDQYDGNFGMFIFRGARLLKIIFPGFPPEFEAELLGLIREGGNQNIEVVLAVLRTYEGQPFIHNVCKAVVRAIPVDSKYRGEVAAALEATGVVSGEYGFAEAYARKKEELKDWLNDPDERVQSFAKRYIERLDQMIAAERKRVGEEIALRKHRYGE